MGMGFPSKALSIVKGKLFGELVGAVVVCAVCDLNGKSVGTVIGPHQMVA